MKYFFRRKAEHELGSDVDQADVSRGVRWAIVLIPAVITSLVALIPFGFEYYKK
jgi:hypothetical protein